MFQQKLESTVRFGRSVCLSVHIRMLGNRMRGVSFSWEEGGEKARERDFKREPIEWLSKERGRNTHRAASCNPFPNVFSPFLDRWLVYSKPFFDDDPYVLEPGGYPNLQAWGAKDPSICSMHPIKLVSILSKYLSPIIGF